MKFLISTIVLAFLLAACNRNVGPLPEAEPEYDQLFFAGTVTAEPVPPVEGVLFVAAGPMDGGPPPLVARLEVQYWPVAFTLSDLDLMGNLALVAGQPMKMFGRFDVDGDVNTRGAFDMEFRGDIGYAAGTTDIRIVLAPLPDAPAATLAVSGTVRGDANIDTAGKIMYVIARTPDRPMPLAVQRIDYPVLPQKFMLTDQHLLAQSTALPARIEVVIRLDSDGDPMTRTADDWEARIPAGPLVRKTALQIQLQPVP